jgi:tRNA (guanine37-N1)-methyltransferase
LFQEPEELTIHNKLYPNNSRFEDFFLKNPKYTKVTISLTPRGFPLNQKMIEWLSQNFLEINLLCGRYEGFDHRVDEFADLEISLGSFVLNGGEVASMAMIEAISRLVPDFISKTSSSLHDSFSSHLNQYLEQEKYIIGERKLKELNTKKQTIQKSIKTPKLFDNYWWSKHILSQIEHPQYTRPETFLNMQVPSILLNGDHKKISNWRKSFE